MIRVRLREAAYINELGFFFFLRIAVEVSSSWEVSIELPLRLLWIVSTSFLSPPAGSLVGVSTVKKSDRGGSDIRQVDPLLLVGVIWFSTHVCRRR